MHARASTMNGDPAKVDATSQMLENELYGQLEQIDGFRGVVALGDRDTGKSLVVTFWDSQAAMAASSERANQMRAAAADELGAGAPEVETYEVLFYRAK